VLKLKIGLVSLIGLLSYSPVPTECNDIAGGKMGKLIYSGAALLWRLLLFNLNRGNCFSSIETWI